MSEQSLIYVEASEANSVVASGILFHFLATGAQTGGAYGLMELIVPSQIGPPMHRHKEQEAFLVLEGAFTFHVGDQPIEGVPGTFVNIPSLMFHVWKNTGDGPGRLLTLAMPGGIEQFFLEAGHPVTDTTVLPPPPTHEEIQMQIALSAKYGIEVKPPSS